MLSDRMKQSLSFILGLLLLLASTPLAHADDDVTLTVKAGWSERLRPGRWVPITIITSSPTQRAAYVEVVVPRGGSYVMKMQQRFTLGPTPITLQVYAPLNPYAGMDELSVTLHDAESSKTLAQWPDEEQSDRAMRYSYGYDSQSGRLVGATGSPSGLGTLGESMEEKAEVAHMPTALLPPTPIGYDSIDLLVLNRPQLAGGREPIAADRQQAMVDWVRGGGTVVLWAGSEIVPTTGPLAEVLPADVGDVIDYRIPEDERSHVGLLARFAAVRGRALKPRDGVAVEKVPMLGTSGAFAARRRLGLGYVIVLPIDPTELQFDGEYKARQFWQPVLSGTSFLSHDRPGGITGAGDEAGRQTRAIGVLQNYLGDVPGAGKFGFSYVAWVLFGMMLVVGPLDWFVLRKLGRQHWTWTTTAGWIGLVTVGALYIGHVFKSGDLYYRTIRVVDQADGQIAGEASLIGIYSPRTTTYHLDAPAAPGTTPPPGSQPNPPLGWWEPASGDQYGYYRGMRHDMPFRQSDEGNAPLDLLINVWNLRFLRSDSSAPGGEPLIEAKLSYKNTLSGDVIGTIRNISDRPLINVRVRLAGGFLSNDPAGGDAAAKPLIARLEPGPSVSIEATVREADLTRWQRNPLGYRYDEGEQQVPDTHVWAMAMELSGRRSQRIDTLVANGQFAALYAEFAEPRPAATLREGGAITKHHEFLRVLVPITRPEPGAPDRRDGWQFVPPGGSR